MSEAHSSEDDPKDDEIELVLEDGQETGGAAPGTGQDEIDTESEPTEEELAAYSERVQKRIKGMTRQKHDLRRRAEEAEARLAELDGQRAEALRFAKTVSDKNQQLQSLVSSGEGALIKSIKERTESAIESARAELRAAHQSGDADKILEASERLNRSQIELAEVDRRERSYEARKQQPDQGAQQPSQAQQPAQARQPQVVVTDRDRKFGTANPWFMKDKVMTAATYGVHEELLAAGVAPGSEDYYGKLEARLEAMFPGKITRTTAESSGGDAGEDNVQSGDDGGEDSRAPNDQRRDAPPVNVAPQSRSGSGSAGSGGQKGPRRQVRLTEDQQAVAKALGVSLEDYARQMVALEAQENQGG